MWMSVKYLEGGRSGSRPHIACEGARGQQRVRSDIARAERVLSRHGQPSTARLARVSSRPLRWPASGSAGAGAGRTKQHAGKGLAARAMQQRAGWRRTSCHAAPAARTREERANAPGSSHGQGQPGGGWTFFELVWDLPGLTPARVARGIFCPPQAPKNLAQTPFP